jgi:hypothetical protein
VAAGPTRSTPLRLLGRSFEVKHGAAVLRLRCAVAARCRGTVRLRRHGTTIGAARFKATSVCPGVVRVALRSGARRLLAKARRGRLSATARVRARDASGNRWQSIKVIRLARRRI